MWLWSCAKKAHSYAFLNNYDSFSFRLLFIQMATTKVPEVRDITRIERIGRNPYLPPN